MTKHLEVHKSMGASGDVVLVRLSDKRLIDPPLIQETGDEIAALVEEGHKKFVVSFASVEIFSTALLGRMVKIKLKLDEQSGALRISNLRPAGRDAFKVTNLDRLFAIKETEKDALADF